MTDNAMTENSYEVHESVFGGPVILNDELSMGIYAACERLNKLQRDRDALLVALKKAHTVLMVTGHLDQAARCEAAIKQAEED